MRKLLKGSCFSLCLVALSALSAIPAQALTATQTIQKVVQTVNSDGSKTTKYIDADLVTPGETIIYKLDFTNDGAEPASNLLLTMPVPEAIKYIEGSADFEGAVLLYSADKGQTFSERKSVKVKSESGEIISAKASDITHIQWKLAGPFAPDEGGVLSFQGVLK